LVEAGEEGADSDGVDGLVGELPVDEKLEAFKKAIEGTQFEKDFEESFSMNGSPMSRAYYNLVVSIRDFKLYAMGMKPNRHWKVKPVKEYFGIKGNTDKCVETLEDYLNIVKGL